MIDLEFQQVVVKSLSVLFGSFLMFSTSMIKLTHKTCVSLVILQWSIIKNRIENRTSPYFVMIIGSACLLISYLNT